MRFKARQAMLQSLSYQNVVYKSSAIQAKAYVWAAKLLLLKFGHAWKAKF